MRINREALKAIRERSAMTFQQLADETGTSAGYIHDIEAGRRNPSPSTMIAIAKALRVSVPAITQEEQIERITEEDQK